jgi:hypothetical protein
MISGLIALAALAAPHGGASATPVPVLEFSRSEPRGRGSSSISISEIGHLPDGRALYRAHREDMDRTVDSIACPAVAMLAETMGGIPSSPVNGDDVIAGDATRYSLTIHRPYGSSTTMNDVPTGPLTEWIDASLTMLAGCWQAPPKD